MTGLRAFIAVVGIVLAAVGLLLVLFTLGAFPDTVILGVNLGDLVNNFTYAALGFLVIVVGVLLITIATFFRGTAQKEAQAKDGGSIVNYSEIGEVRIAFKAVESMVLAAAKKVSGIREVTAHIDAVEQGLIINLRIKAIPDIPIPGLSGELQTKVRDYVREISGTNISEVKVFVENIAHDTIQRNPR